MPDIDISAPGTSGPALTTALTSLLSGTFLSRTDVTVKAWYPTPAAMVAAGDAGYGDTAFAPGDIVEAGGYRYVVAASGATDNHLINGALVKFYALPVNGKIVPEQLGYTDALANLGAVLQAAWNAGLVVHLGAKEYLTSTTAYLRSRTGLIGCGSSISIVKAANGFTGNVIDTQNFDTLAATDEADNGDGVLQGVVLKDFGIDGNRAAFGATVTTANGFGLRLYCRQPTISGLRITRTAGVGMLTHLTQIGNVTETYHPKTHAKPGFIRDVWIGDTGQEGFIFRGPTDIRLDSVFVGWPAGSLTDAYNAGSPKTSLHYPGETIDGMVFDNAGCEIGQIHAFDNYHGWGVKVRSDYVEIAYTGATSMTGVAVGTTMTSSGATGVLVSKAANGASGTLVLRNVSGTFTPSQTITGGAGSATITTVIARSPRFRCTDFMSERNFGQLWIGPQVRYEIEGEVHNNEGGNGSRPIVQDNSVVGGLARLKVFRGGTENGSTSIELKGAKGIWDVQAQTNFARAGHGIDLSGTDYIVTAMVERASGTTYAGETSSGIVFRVSNARNRVTAKARACARGYWFLAGSCVGNVLDLQSVDHTGGAGADYFGIGNLGPTERRLAGLSTVTDGAISWENAPYAPALVTVSALLASTMPYGPGRVVGQELVAGGFAYRIAPAAAADHHLTTAGGVKLYVLPGAEGWNPRAFGAVWDGAANDTAAIQAAIDAACIASGNNGDEAHSIVHFPAGMTRANGLVVNSHNVRISGWGCMLKSFAPQAAPQYLLSFVGGGFDEGQLIINNAIYGLSLNGANHANVHGLHLSGVAHFHYWHARIRSFGGAGGGCGLRLENAYDCEFWGGYVDWCGRDGGSAAASTAAVQIASSTIDSSNQIYFRGYTWEANAGLDVAFLGPEANPFPNNAISFVDCKWEQSSSRTVYAGVWTQRPVQNAVTFEGKGYVAGYHRDGGWLDMNIAASAKIVVSPSYDFGYKTDQPPSGTPPATIRLRGLGKALLGGRLSDARIATIPWIDTETKEPTDIRFSDVATAGTAAGKVGWLWKTKDGSTSRCQAEGGRLTQVFKLAANEAASFFPRGESGILQIMMHDRPAACGFAAIVCEAGGSAAIHRIGEVNWSGDAGEDLEIGIGALVTGATTTTANRLHLRVHTDGKMYLQNRFSFSAVVYLHLAATLAF